MLCDIPSCQEVMVFTLWQGASEPNMRTQRQKQLLPRVQGSNDNSNQSWVPKVQVACPDKLIAVADSQVNPWILRVKVLGNSDSNFSGPDSENIQCTRHNGRHLLSQLLHMLRQENYLSSHLYHRDPHLLKTLFRVHWATFLVPWLCTAMVGPETRT